MRNLWIVFGVLAAIGCGKKDDAAATATRTALAVKDAAGGNLGILLTGDGTDLTIQSPTGWIYKTTWLGTFPSNSPFVYPGSSCSGTKKIDVTYTTSPHSGKQIFSDGTKLYRPASVNADGTAAGTSFSWQSRDNFNSCFAVSASGTAVDAVEVSLADIGLPATITTPLSITAQ